MLVELASVISVFVMRGRARKALGLRIADISLVWVYSVKYSSRWVENVFFPTLNYKYILHQH